MQAFRQGINGDQPAGMNQVAFFQRLPFRRFENKLPFKQPDLAAEHDFHVRCQRFCQILIIEPHCPHIAGFIADNRFGTAPSARHRDFGLPDIGDDGFFLTLAKLGNGFHLTVVDMTAGEKVKQIADGSYAQLAEFCGETGADAFDCCDRSVERLVGTDLSRFWF